MVKMNLQLFGEKPEAVHGKKLIYLYRLLEKASTSAAKGLAFTTENEKTMSKDTDSEETKDGPIIVPGATEIEITATSFLTAGDTLIDDMEDALINGKTVEIWEANLAEKAEEGENKFKGTYYQGKIKELSKSSASDSYVELSMTFGIDGTGAKGDVTVTAEQQEQASYVFKDTTQEA